MVNVLDKNSPIPLYYQLAEDLRDKIRAGELTPGEQVPTERELSELHGISRMTVRQALQFLVREEVLVSRQGSGTYVAEPKLTYDPLHVLGFTENMMQRGLENVSSKVLEHVIAKPPSNVATRLKLGKSQRATKIMRLRLSGAMPLLLETVWVPAQLFPGLEKTDMANQSLYAVMRERYGIYPAGSLHSIEAVQANDYECDLFGLGNCAPMILLTGVTVDQHDRPIEYFKAAYRGDRFEIVLDSRVKTNVSNVSMMSIAMR